MLQDIPESYDRTFGVILQDIRSHINPDVRIHINLRSHIHVHIQDHIHAHIQNHIKTTFKIMRKQQQKTYKSPH